MIGPVDIKKESHRSKLGANVPETESRAGRHFSPECEPPRNPANLTEKENRRVTWERFGGLSASARR